MQSIISSKTKICLKAGENKVFIKSIIVQFQDKQQYWYDSQI